MGRAQKTCRLTVAATAVAAAALMLITPTSAGTVDGARSQHLRQDAALEATSGPQSDRRSHSRRSWIAFVSDRASLDQQEAANDDIYLLDPRSGRTVRIIADPAASAFPTTEQFPIISADGQILLFESNRSTADFPNPDGSLDLFAFYTCRVHLEARTPRCTHLRRVARTVPPAYYQYYALTPDRRTLVYVDPSGDLYRAPLNGSSAPVKLASAALQPDVSPDGRRIAYVSIGNIWTINLDGTDPDQLTDRLIEAVPPVYAGPDWSPDGRQLAFHSTRGGLPDFDVWVMRATPLGPGNIPVDLTETLTGPDGQRPSHERFPTWSPDGRQIAFFWHREPPTAGRTAGFNEGEIYVMDDDGADVRNLTANYDVTRNWDDPAQIGDISPDWGAGKRR